MSLELECKIAPGGRQSKGYAVAYYQGKRTTAHRAVFAEFHGLTLAELEGLVIRHKCDNRGCIEPTHLESGTYQQNTQDMLDRGREARGFRLPQTKLSDTDRAEIARLYSLGARNKDLAARYGVAPSTISRCVRATP